jgi:pyruvate dehydrogenase E1 component alpha subunit
MGDPERYRSTDEIRKWQEDDPIGLFRKRLLEAGPVDAASLDEQEAQVLVEIDEAVRFAEESPEPTPDELYADVYAEGVS